MAVKLQLSTQCLFFMVLIMFFFSWIWFFTVLTSLSHESDSISKFHDSNTNLIEKMNPNYYYFLEDEGLLISENIYDQDNEDITNNNNNSDDDDGLLDLRSANVCKNL